MKEKRKKKILGSLYPIYRRMRYLRYVKKINKIRKKEFKQEQEIESLQHKSNYSQQRSREKEQKKAYKKRIREEKKQANIEHKRAVKLQIREDKIHEKKKRSSERKEKRELLLEAKQSLGPLSKQEKQLEKARQKQTRIEQRQEKEEIRSRLKQKVIQDRELEKSKKLARLEQKRERKRRKKELRPYLVKRRKRELIRTFKQINAESFKKGFSFLWYMVENTKERNLFFKITFNSVSLFVLSYLTIHILGDIITLYAAQSFNYDTILFYYKIYYNIESDQWTPDAVKILYSIKPLVGLVIGTIAMIIFSSLKNLNMVFKLYFLWLFIHGMVMLFGALLVGNLLNQGFGWVIAYLYYKDTGKMAFSIMAIFALVVTGSATARSFLISGNAYFNNINRDNRKFLLISQILIPAVLGTIFIAFLKFPHDFYFTTSEQVIFEILKTSSIIIILIPLTVAFSSLGSIFFDEDVRTIRFKWAYIVVSLLIYFSYMYFFRNGVVIQA